MFQKIFYRKINNEDSGEKLFVHPTYFEIYFRNNFKLYNVSYFNICLSFICHEDNNLLLNSFEIFNPICSS